MRNSNKPPLLQFDCIKKALDDWIALQSLPGLQESWLLAQEIIEAQARFYGRFWSVDISRAKAWEDFDIACRGQGSPGIGGAVFELWSSIPPDYEIEFLAVLNTAIELARSRTDLRYARYNLVARTKPLRTLSQGFCLPQAAPVDFDIPTAQSVRDFALSNGTEVPISKTRTKENHESQQKGPVFTVFPGGRDTQ
jgi:hypothetical protein